MKLGELAALNGEPAERFFVAGDEDSEHKSVPPKPRGNRSPFESRPPRGSLGRRSDHYSVEMLRQTGAGNLESINR